MRITCEIEKTQVEEAVIKELSLGVAESGALRHRINMQYGLDVSADDMDKVLTGLVSEKHLTCSEGTYELRY